MSGYTYLDLMRLTAPEIAVALTAMLVLLVDLSLLRVLSLRARLRGAVLVSCCGLTLGLLAAHASQPGGLPNGMLLVTPLSLLLQMALLMLAVAVLLLADASRFTTHVGEYCALILFATAAMMLLVSTQNLLMVFISIEFLSLSLYTLTAFDKTSQASAEAGLKYFLFGGMSAGLLLFGISILYGLSGSLALHQIATASGNSPGDPLWVIAFVMIAAGFGFKVAAAPFHMWAPEVYQGAPAASGAFIASSSKVASFFAFFTVFVVGLKGVEGSAAWAQPFRGWAPLIALVAAVSMCWGNFAAIAQTSTRRLLAYSAIGHAGYALLALVAHTGPSLSALVFYVITYALATLGAFGVLSVVDTDDLDSIQNFSGLAKRSPDLAACTLIFFLSLAGIPPLAGFFGKFYLFATALNTEHSLGLAWLVLLAIAMSVVSFYYYLRVLKHVYVSEPAPGSTAIRVPLLTRLTLLATAGLVVILGCLPNLLLHHIAAAVASAY